jgi:uncharacterized protein (TIGR02145 family)
MFKNYLTLVLATLLLTSSFAQKSIITLKFTANNNNQHVPMNDILIENLTQGSEIRLFAPDTLIVLDIITGIDNLDPSVYKGIRIYQNYPNPITDHSTVYMNIDNDENVRITVTDILGKYLIDENHNLSSGQHAFTFTPGNEDIYLLSVIINHERQTIKMMNSSNPNSVSKFCKLKYDGNQSNNNLFKSGNNRNSFSFRLGDMLKFTANSYLGERVITSYPTKDRTYSFQFNGVPCPDSPTVNDIDGNIYNTVQIGDQCWMKENLLTTTYRDGTKIHNITNPDDWQNQTTGAFAYYDNDKNWKERYGVIYNWYSAESNEEICPEGWHIPTTNEWSALFEYNGGVNTAGKSLKSCKTQNTFTPGNSDLTQHPRWNHHPSCHGDDNYGFSAMPGGSRTPDGSFMNLGKDAIFWSSSELYTTYANGIGIYHCCDNSVEYEFLSRNNGLSIRCIKD